MGSAPDSPETNDIDTESMYGAPLDEPTDDTADSAPSEPEIPDASTKD